MSQLQRRTSTTERYQSLNLHKTHKISKKVYGWGRSDKGQLGTCKNELISIPFQLNDFESKDIIQIALSTTNTAAVTDDGEVYMCGENENGQLGMKNKEIKYELKKIMSLDCYRITQVSLSENHALATTENGVMVAWGSSEYGQLGLSTNEIFNPHPKTVKIEDNTHIIRVAAGLNHSLALASNGSVYSCGQGIFGALGHGDMQSLNTFRIVRSLRSQGILQICCGENHSAALTVEGKVYTWGLGKYGQTGQGHFENCSTPEAIELPSDEIKGKQIALGADHSLMLAKNGDVYAWGQGFWGQTGLGHKDNTSRPQKLDSLNNEYITQVTCGQRHSLLSAQRGAIFIFGDYHMGNNNDDDDDDKNPILIPKQMHHLKEMSILFISSGGFHNIVVLDDSPDASKNLLTNQTERYGKTMLPVKFPNFTLLLQKAEKVKSDQSVEMVSLLYAIQDIYSCPGFLLHLYLKSRGRTTDQLKEYKLDIKEIIRVYEVLYRFYNPNLIALLGKSCLRALDIVSTISTKKNEYELSALNNLRVIMICLINPSIGEVTGSGIFLVRVITTIINKFPTEFIKTFRELLMELPVEVFGGRVLRGLHKYIASLTVNYNPMQNRLPEMNRLEALDTAHVMLILYQVSINGNDLVRFERFYNKSLCEAVDWMEEYNIWKNDHRNNRNILNSFCEVPFLISPEYKAKIIHVESIMRQRMEIQQSQIQALMSGIPPNLVSFLHLQIRRDHIRQDAFNQIVMRKEDFHKPLKITFISNGVPEEGEDQGGLSKEFFQLLIEEIFNEDFGLFVYNEENRTYWFTANEFANDEFELIGYVLGLAIYNNVILDIHFPLVVYKKLIGELVQFSDLKEAFPELGKGLQQLLDFEGDVENTFFRTFSIEYKLFGEVKTAELKAGGNEIPVTNENRKEFVDLYTKFVLEDSVRQPFDAFANAFFKFLSGAAFTLFRFEELELLICGLPHLDFNELEKGTKYDGGYHPNHPVIINFWSIIHEMTLEQKKQFLAFTTGCDRAPVGGLSKLTMVIQRAGPDSHRLPTSHTCFNILLLPEYGSREKLKERLLLAVQNAQGFGLQ